MMKLFFALLLLIIASLSGCVKAPSYPIEPKIEYKSVASTASVIYMDGGTPIYVADTIIVSFTDGDGDISVYDDPADSNLCVDPCAYAEGDTSCVNIKSKNVFIVDSRDGCIATYNTGFIEPQGKFQSLSGEIKILHKIFLKQCLAPSVSCPRETVTFKIRIKDRAGHLSNEVETVPITVEVQNL
jgi:hypothetical protein